VDAKPENLAKFEQEMLVLEKDFLAHEDTYNKNVVDLTLARSYLKKLLDNGKVVRFLAQRYRELLVEFQGIIESASLEN
jgi:hypothetical protein